MKKLAQNIQNSNPRQAVLLILTVLVAVGALVVGHYLVPAYDEWNTLRQTLYLQVSQHASLARNVMIKDSVAKQFQALDPEMQQTDSDHVTLSKFLRELETMRARNPSIILINAKPLPVKSEATHKLYRIKLSVAGNLTEILQFVSDLANGPTVTGLETFSLRGVQGNNVVECSLSIWTVRLIRRPREGGKTYERTVSSYVELAHD